jgi:hypothetical protein
MEETGVLLHQAVGRLIVRQGNLLDTVSSGGIRDWIYKWNLFVFAIAFACHVRRTTMDQPLKSALDSILKVSLDEGLGWFFRISLMRFREWLSTPFM